MNEEGKPILTVNFNEGWIDVFTRNETHSSVLVSISTCYFKNNYYLFNCDQPWFLLSLSPMAVDMCEQPIYTIEWEGEMELFLLL